MSADKMADLVKEFHQLSKNVASIAASLNALRKLKEKEELNESILCGVDKEHELIDGIGDALEED